MDVVIANAKPSANLYIRSDRTDIQPGDQFTIATVESMHPMELSDGTHFSISRDQVFTVISAEKMANGGAYLLKVYPYMGSSVPHHTVSRLPVIADKLNWQPHV